MAPMSILNRYRNRKTKKDYFTPKTKNKKIFACLVASADTPSVQDAERCMVDFPNPNTYTFSVNYVPG